MLTGWSHFLGGFHIFACRVEWLNLHCRILPLEVWSYRNDVHLRGEEFRRLDL
jgi:hypothetical protein